MLLIQKLINDKMLEGKSRTRIAEEAGVSKTAIHNYYHNSAAPEGKSLVLLAKYFNVPMEDLLDIVKQSADQDEYIQRDRRHAIELRLIVDELEGLSPTEQLEWLLRIRKEKEARQLK